MLNRLYWRLFAWGLMPWPPLAPWRVWRARKVNRRELRRHVRIIGQDASLRSRAGAAYGYHRPEEDR